jgi:CubicO group peptidase (beta-lactamase class C family)
MTTRILGIVVIVACFAGSAMARPQQSLATAQRSSASRIHHVRYALPGRLAEKIEGQPLANIFQNRLFGPTGMKNTVLPAGTSNTIPQPYSHGYLYGSSA